MKDGLIPRLLAAVVGVGVLIVSFFVGFVFFVAALGLALLAWVVAAIRVWRLRRRAGQGRPHGPQRNTTIEGEYRVVHQEEDHDGR